MIKACFHPDYNPLYMVSPDLNTWKITISDAGLPIIIDTAETFIPGEPPLSVIPSFIFISYIFEVCITSPNLHMWHIHINDDGTLNIVDSGDLFDSDGVSPAVRQPTAYFHPSYFKFFLVSPNNHIWDISVDNSGNSVRTDTGETL